MTTNDLREDGIFMSAWPATWPMLRQFLTDRLLERARGAKCQLETAQAESARQNELSLLITELGMVASPVREDEKPRRMMKPLHSMSEEPET